MTSVGTPVELARYRISAGERVVRGQRILGVVRVTDAPADGLGRTYLIERGLSSYDELLGLVCHYVDHARHCDGIPLLCLYPHNDEASR